MLTCIQYEMDNIMATKTRNKKKTKPSFGSKAKAQSKNKHQINPAIDSLLHEGKKLQNQGLNEHALDMYKNILALDPRHAEANFLVGTLMNFGGDHNTAIKFIRKAIEENPNDSTYYNSLGLAYNSASRKMEASASFKKAINVDSTYVAAYLNFAQILADMGSFEEALDQYTSALALAPNSPETLIKIATLHIEQNDIPLALEACSTACKHVSVSSAPLLQQWMDSFQVSHDKNSPLFRLGVILGFFQENYYAVICMAKIVEIDPDFTQAYLYFSQLVRSHSITSTNSEFAPLIEKLTINCLARTDIPKDNLRSQIIATIGIDSATNDIKMLAEANDEESIEILQNNTNLNKILLSPCFLYLLKNSNIDNMLTDLLITQVRRCLLFSLLSSSNSLRNIIDQFGRLITALSCHCFITEYVYYVSHEEQAALIEFEKITTDKLTMLDPDAPVYAAMLGCYISLRDSKKIGTLITQSQFSTYPDIQPLIKLQIVNPENEKDIAKSIKKLKAIEDDTSKLVRQQYEENPYPRWINAPYTTPVLAQQFIQNEIAPNTPKNLLIPDNPRVLIAGCGTGKHPISCAMTYKNASVLAVDLSLASLSYAQRQANELNVTNIDFMQADILDLGTLHEKFDIIESAGVLHHMKDPLAGWRVLEKLLKPNGLLKIGLYSELARVGVIAARDFIAKQGFGTTPEDIRECRKLISEMDDNSTIKKVVSTLDFFTTSMLRDLIFHSMEHRFTIPKINEILTLLNFEFLGFIIPDEYKIRYLLEFKGDNTATSLENWHTFETKKPDTFKSMYNFWLRKKNSSI